MSDTIEWYTPHVSSLIGAIGAGAQTTVFDLTLRDPINLDLYSGTIVGGQIWFSLDSAIGPIANPPCLYFMILPAGMAVPGVTTELGRYQSQDFMWLQTVMTTVGARGRDFQGGIKLPTKRNFKRGDRLVCVLVNRDIANYGAAARVCMDLDLYIYGSV